MHSIEAHIKALLETAWKRRYTVARLAAEAGVDRSVFSRVQFGKKLVIGKDGFNPTVRIVQALENVIGPTDAIVSLENSAAAVVDRQEFVGRQHTVRVLLNESAVPILAGELAQVVRYCEGLKRDRGGLFSEDLNYDVLRYLAPGARFHLATAPPNATEAVWARWDSTPDFFSGDDLSGLPVSFAGDEVFEEEIHKDLEMAREAGIPLYHAIYRSGIVRQTEPPMKRMYFRLLQRLKRRDGGFEIFWVTIRKNLQSNVDLFSDLLGGRPDEV